MKPKVATLLLTTTLAGVLTLSVAGCNKAPEVTASAVPRTSVGTEIDDSVLTTKVKASFVDTKDLYGSAFKVVTEDGSVYLMGRVTQREGNLAGEVARGVSGVRKVVKVFDYISEGELTALTAVAKGTANPAEVTPANLFYFLRCHS